MKRKSFWKHIQRGTSPATVQQAVAGVVANAARGARAKREGQDVEAALTESMKLYRLRGFLSFSKQEPRVVGPPTDLRYAKKNDVDFLGWWRDTPTTDARPLAFDAKSSHAASFSLPSIDKNARTMLKQIDFLLDFGTPPNADAFLLVIDRTMQCGWFLFEDALRTVREERTVPLRTVAKRKSATADALIVHHAPVFHFASTLQMVRGMPSLPFLHTLATLRGTQITDTH
jgi:hypothetical protein